VKPTPWAAAEELPISTYGVLPGKRSPNGVKMPDFRLVKVI
jgi:hypothetical protein